MASRKKRYPVPEVLVAEAQTDETRNDVEGRTVRKKKRSRVSS